MRRPHILSMDVDCLCLFYRREISLLKLSLIIHEEKTREITTVKEVWISDHNYHKIRCTFALNFSKNYQCFAQLYQKLERVFHHISEHFEVGLKSSAVPRFLNPLLTVWIFDATFFLMFDILLRQ